MGDVKQLISEGAQFFKDGKLEEAIAKLKAAVEEDPSSVQAHSYLGAAFARNGENPESVEQFQLAVDLAPNSAVHTFNLGQAYETSGGKPRAQALYEKALALDPKYARARQRLEALTGQSSTPQRPATPAPAPPPAQTVSMPSTQPPVGATQVGAPYSPPPGGPAPYGTQPSYGGGPQYGAPPMHGPPPGLTKKSVYISYADPWKRLVAMIIDNLLLGAVGAGIGFAMAKPELVPATSQTQQLAPIAALVSKLQFTDVVISFLYFVLFNSLLGQTPGKIAMSIRILKADGSKIGVGTAIVRYLIQNLLGALTCGLINLVIIFNSENRGVHDQVAGTVVADG